MKKCAFINPYFGTLPKSFPLFLKTCQINSDFDWYFFTDDDTEFDYPDNVKKIKMSFNEMQKLAQSKFDFPIVLDKPYKLCDYKPAYGYIFEDYLDGYEFWGHCDIDTLMGDLNLFLTDEFLSKYDKLFTLGHMILYRNSYENNRVFMKSKDGRYLYKESYTTSEITKFDETYGGDDNVNSIFLANNKRVFQEDWSENFLVLSTRFTRIKYSPEKNAYIKEPYIPVLYFWSKGAIYRYYINNGKFTKENVMYMHFQDRILHYREGVIKATSFIVVPNNCIQVKYDDINEDLFKHINKNPISFHRIEFEIKRLKKKINRMKKRNR